jgi:23S rRNA (cytidine1920-2'-O)/16S rRNA (cytidine1409-2'-O)-methyltransferase
MTQRATNRRRADQLWQDLGLAPTRARARALIEEGRVSTCGNTITKAGQILRSDALLSVADGVDFVSRGGRKLDGALAALGVDVHDAVVADVGASTGGFTDCVLRRGARKVYAIDVGAGQLAPDVRDDPRVVVMDRTNARDLVPGQFDEPLDVVLVDASFIGLDKLAPALGRIVPRGRTLVALVKPQFQVGREAARRTRGVVRDPSMRAEAIATARRALEAAGFSVTAERDSDVPGPDGNVECFLVATRG